MNTWRWLLAALAVIAVVLVPLCRRLGRSRIFCCALCLAACVCSVATVAMWRWMPNAYRPVVRVAVLPGEQGDASGDIWLRNVFSIFGADSTPTFPKVRSGVWAQADDGLRWQAEPEIAGQTDAIELSLPAAERYAVFFYGNRQSGKALLTYPETGERETVDTYRDSDGFEPVIVDIGLNGAPTLSRLRWAQAMGALACVAVSAALFAGLYRLLRRHRVALGRIRRASARAFRRRLMRGRLASASLDPRRWRWYTFALCGLFLIPLLWIAVYAHPVWDDFSNGTPTRLAWRQTGSLIAVLRAAAGSARGFYATWQGSFAATFLMALQPGIFGERWYVLTPYLLIGGLIGATWLLARTALGKRCGSVLGWLALFFSIQYVYGARELFFWFNGGSYYTLFYSLSLLLYSLVLGMHQTTQKAKRAAYAAGASLAAFVVGGGNYVTALLSCVLLSLWTGYRILQKDRLWWNPLLPLACLVGALLFSMAAPGNGVRQSQSQGMPYMQAVFASFPQALAYFRDRLRVEYLLGAVIAVPFLVQVAERRPCAFRYPALVTLASLGAYACQFTPHLAADSTTGPARLLGIIFFAGFWMVGGNLFYWLGWAAKRGKLTETVRILARWAAVGAAALLVLACAATALREPRALNGVTAAESLADGSAQRYSQALYERAAVFEDETIHNVRVPPLPEPIYLLMSAEMMEDETQWVNEITAAYYGKDSVSVVPVAE